MSLIMIRSVKQLLLLQSLIKDLLNGPPILSLTQFSSVTQSCPTLCKPMDCSTPVFPVHQQLLEPTQTHVHHVADANQASILCLPLLFHFQSFPASGSFQKSHFFTSSGQSIAVSASASMNIVLPMNIQDWFSLGGLVVSPCCPRDSQESSPTPQFKNLDSSVLSFLYSPTLTSIHDHWKNHSLD